MRHVKYRHFINCENKFSFVDQSSKYFIETTREEEKITKMK
jgi:hypothetical protein